MVAVERSGGGERMLIVANLSANPADYRVTGSDLMTGRRIAGGLHLEPYETKVIRVNP